MTMKMMNNKEFWASKENGGSRMEGQTFKIHFKKKCPQRQITECLISDLISSDCLFHSSKFLD